MTDSFKLDSPLESRESASDAIGTGASADLGGTPRGLVKN
jgi:hypothetical protein